MPSFASLEAALRLAEMVLANLKAKHISSRAAQALRAPRAYGSSTRVPHLCLGAFGLINEARSSIRALATVRESCAVKTLARVVKTLTSYLQLAGLLQAVAEIANERGQTGVGGAQSRPRMLTPSMRPAEIKCPARRPCVPVARATAETPAALSGTPVSISGISG